MNNRTYRIHCEYCGYNRITDGTDVDDLNTHSVAAVPGGYPKPNATSGKMEPRPLLKRGKWFKCPKCGRALTPKIVNVPKLGPDENV